MIQAPRIILDAVSRGGLSGSFPGTAVIADIRGFTSRFHGMAGLGDQGAEKLSQEVGATLSRVVSALAPAGGFPVSFAGDAVTVVFPGDSALAREACEALRTHPPEGALPLRISTGTGLILWDLIPRDGWSFYSFQGSALSMAAGSPDSPGSRGSPVPLDSRDLPPKASTGSAAPGLRDNFLPPRLFRGALVNQFRQVTSVFLSLENRGGSNCPRGFQELVLEAAEEFGGYASGLDAGSEGHRMLVVFGAPVTREDDPGRADRFIGKVFSGAPGRVRAGTSGGPVFSGLIRTPMLSSYTVLGPSVNLAARLHDAAGWNSIFSDRVFSASSNLMRIREMELSLKGFPAGVPACALSPWKTRPDARGSEPPLIERDDTVAMLEAALDEPGSVVFLNGETGVGKTRLTREIRARRKDTFFMNLQCRSLPAAGADIFAGWFSEWLGPRGDDRGLSVFREKLYGFVERLEELDDPRALREADELLRAESVLAALVGLGWENSLYGSLDPGGRFRNTVAVITAFIRGNALMGRTVLTVDDLQWIDPDSSRLLASVLDELGDLRPPVVLMGRPDAAARVADLGLAPVSIELSPLSREGCGAFLEWSLGQFPSPSLLDWFYLRTEGVPFFMEQYAGMLESSGEPPDEDHFPGSLHALLVARLDRLGPELRRAVLAASVLGREFEGELLRLVHPEGDCGRLLRKGVEKRVWSLGEDGTCSFVHVLLREAAYRLQTPSRRAELHGMAGEGMEGLWGGRAEKAGMTAHHMELAGRATDASRWYMKAGEYSLSRNMNTASLVQMEKVLELSADPDLRLWAHRRIYDVHISLGDLESAGAAIEKASVEAGSEPGSLAHVRLMRAQLAVHHGNPGDVQAHLEGLETMNPSLRPEILLLRGRVLMLQGRTVEAMDQLYRVYLDLREGTPEERLLAHKALGNAGACGLRLRSDLEHAEEWIKEVLAFARETGNLMMETLSVGNLALLYKYLPGRREDAMKTTRIHLELARRTGSRLLELQALGNLGALIERKGPSEEALRLLRETVEMARRYGGSETLAIALANLANALIRLGRGEEALRLFEETLEICREAGLGVYRVDYALEMASALMDMGKLREASELVARVGEWDLSSDYQCFLRICRGKLLNLEGKPGEAEKVLRSVLENELDGEMHFELLTQLYRADGKRETLREAVRVGEEFQRNDQHWHTASKLKALKDILSED